ncbi:MAG TPA: ABC transporter substrate-binding protein [Bryobacteraceae bacterium]|nr:ABC transporter substrate-binding protein [Bryobacteraceae bacterium]
MTLALPRGRLGALAIVILACSGCGHPAQPKVRIAVFRGEEIVPLTRALGHFAAMGLDAEISEVASSSKAMEALLGGSVEAVSGGYDHAIRLAAEGRRIRSFAVLSVRSPLALVASPKSSRIRSIRDLKGATVGVSAFGSSGNFFVNLLLAKYGLTARDVHVVATGGGHAVTVSWADQGRVDAIVTLPASLSILRQRHPNLVVLANGTTPEGSRAIFGVDAYPAICLMAQAAWLEQNPGTAKQLSAAVLRTLRWIGEHSPEEFQAKLRGSAGQLEELDGLRATIATRSLDGGMPPGGPEAVREAVAVSAPAVRSVDLKATFTDEYLATTP